MPEELGDGLAGALDWWRMAGVDTLVADTPRNWLAPAPISPHSISLLREPGLREPGLREPGEASVPAPPSISPPGDLPTTLAAFRAWLHSATAVPIPGPPDRRILPAGDGASALMLLAGQPEPGDDTAGQLFSGAIGRLFDRMLAAIGLDRARVWLAPMSGNRAPGGAIDTATLAALGTMARHHLALVAPRLLVVLGDEASRALIGTAVAEARGRVHVINHAGGTVRALAIFHPRFLLQQPARKAEAWSDLRLLQEEMAR